MAEGDSKDEALFRNVVAGLVATAVLVFLALLVLYLWRFAGEGWSPVQAHWGAFGDYLGGTLNPLLGFASVVLLALTLREQRKVLAETKRQAVLEELQRLLSARSQALDEALSIEFDPFGTPVEFLTGARPGAPVRPRSAFAKTKETMSVSDLIYRAYRMLLGRRIGQRELSAVAFETHLQVAFAHLQSLDECLREFLVRGGDPVIARLYGSQYADIALLLHTFDRLATFPPGLLDFPLESLSRLGLEKTAAVAEKAIQHYLEASEGDAPAAR